MIRKWNEMGRAGGAEPRAARKRAGVVLLSVLVVIVILALAGYHFSDFTMGEYKAVHQTQRLTQARALADSGVAYAAAMLGSADVMTNVLGDHPYHNPGVFAQVAVPGDDKTGFPGKFTIVAPPDPEDGGGDYRYGVSDETGKINLNALMRLDPTGQTLKDMLMKLPSMSDEIAASIVDWLDGDSTPLLGGAENDYYSGLTPSYRAKNGPLDSIEELLLVKGVTPELLFGSDRNRNGIVDADEDDGSGPGWASFLTIYSRELNVDAAGQPLLNLNGSDLATLYDELGPFVGDDLAKYIVLYRQNGPANSSGKTQSFGQSLAALLGGGKSGNDKSGNDKGGNDKGGATTQNGNLADARIDTSKRGRTKLSSLFDLADSQVAVTSKDDKGKSITTIYASPLKEGAALRDLLPKLYAVATLSSEPEIPGRINVNTAPREVLLALPGIAASDVDALLSVRPRLSSEQSAGEAYATPAWLLTEAGIGVNTLKKLEKYITSKAQVFRVQVVGTLDQPGPSARVEAIIDTNAGRPRILAWRDLTELGQ